MNEEPSSKPEGPRKPVIVPRQARQTDSPPHRTAPRVMTAPSASPPVPASVIRSLVATRNWASIDAFAFIIFGVLTTVHTAQKWIRLSGPWKEASPDETTRDTVLVRGEMLFSFAFAAGCLFAAMKLFRYSSAIHRLRQASRMHELEKALRHQRTVWVVLGTVGAIWLILFTTQMVYFVIALNGIQEDQIEMDVR